MHLEVSHVETTLSKTLMVAPSQGLRSEMLRVRLSVGTDDCHTLSVVNHDAE